MKPVARAFVRSGGGFVRSGGGFARGGVAGGGGGVDTLESITVTTDGDVADPTFVPVDASSRLQMKAIGNYSISGAVDITALVTWSSTVTAAATIDTAGGAEHGEVTAVSAWNGVSGATGYETTIEATFGAITGDTTVTVDLARDGGIRWPANDFEAQLIGLELDHLWLFDETSGNLIDRIGSLDLSASGTMTYEAAVSGLSRPGVQFSDGVTGSFSVTVGNGPNPAAESVQWAAVADILAAPGGVRHVMSITRGAGGQQGTRVNATPRVDCTTTGGVVVGTANPVTPGVVGFNTVHHRGNSTIRVYTTQETIIGTNIAFVDGVKGVGGVGVSPPSMVMTWACASAAARAEALDSAGIFQRMGLI